MANRYFKKALLSSIVLLFSVFNLTAQTRITGAVTDSKTKEGLAGVSIMVKGKVIGTTTDAKGAFNLATATAVPLKLVVTSVGYESQEIEVTSANANINVLMVEQSIMGQEVVIAASRVEEKVMQSPVSIEKMDIRAIQSTASSNFYDGLASLKGIDVTTQGLLFKSINMRGFNSTGNPRIGQMIDGMDNSAPGLNFAVDNIVGMPELDVESVEVLPGASSALYGPNAVNGMILMNSKSPFLYQGLSASLRSGIMSESNRPTPNTGLYDMSIRYAKAFNNKFAFKTNFSYLKATDWSSTNYTNLNSSGLVNPEARSGAVTDYDGMNVYGDEVQSGMQTVANSLVSLGRIPAAALALVPNVTLSRTGYTENALINPNTNSFKFNGALHYRVSEKLEAIAQVNYGYGTTLYTGTGKYSLKDFNITQAKFELKGDALTVRAYTTQERSGNSWTAGLTAVQMLDQVKPHEQWFGEYVGAYVQARSAGAADLAAHSAARAFADQNMPKPGTAAFDQLLENKSTAYIKGRTGGGAFDDRSNLYHLEAVYNLKNLIKFADVLVGGNLRKYQLRSSGTLFADNVDGRTGTIGINEVGAFVQAAKSLFSNHMRLTGSLRYDKNQNFDAQITPRVSSVFTFGDHNFRLSYQTGFRNPTTQNQYIDLLTPAARLIGGLPEFTTRYNLANAYTREDVAAVGAKIVASTQDPAIRKAATDLVTAGVTTAVTNAVNTPTTQAAIKAGVTSAVTAAVKASVVTGVTAEVRKGVEAQVKAGITTAVTAAVTSAVTAKVNEAVAGGLIPNQEATIAAAIAAGIADALPTQLAGAIATQLAPLTDAQMATDAVKTIVSTNVDATFASAPVQATITSEITKALPGAVASTISSEVAKALPAALAANLPAAIQGVAVNANIGALTPAQIKTLQPERISSYEIGYKGLIAKKLFVDANYYTSKYTNFIGGQVLIVPTASIAPGQLPVTSGVLSGNTRNVFSRNANRIAPINVKGWSLGANYSIGGGYSLGGNIAKNELIDFTPSNEVQYAGFNTPLYRSNINITKRITSDTKYGFTVAFKHQDEFLYEAGFVQPTTTGVPLFKNTLVPAISNLDAQFSYKLSSLKTILKVGGTNLGGKPYVQAYGSPSVGTMYYIQLNFDELMN